MMNKRGQLAEWELVKAVLLFLLIVFFGVVVYQGIPDERVNKIKAEDLSLAIGSVFLVNEDLNVGYEMGREYNVEEINNRIRVYIGNEERGSEILFLDNNYGFAEQVRGKTKIVGINKEGNKVVIS